MREDVPVPPAEDPVAQMQADRAASRAPVKEGPACFFLIMQKVTDIDCVQSDKKTTAETKGQGQMAWKEWWSVTQRPEMNDAVCMFLPNLLIMAGTELFPGHSGRFTTIFSTAAFVKEHVS